MAEWCGIMGLVTFLLPLSQAAVVYYDHSRRTSEGSHGNYIKHDLLGFNASTGIMVWNYTIPGFYNSQRAATPAIANGQLYVSEFGGENGNSIFAFGTAPTPKATSNSTLPSLASIQTLGVVLIVLAIIVIATFIAVTKYLKKNKNIHKSLS
jgi:outer membrane protein assembly factor BamB